MFNGDKHTLTNYVEACEYLIGKFLATPNAAMELELLMLFKGKLEGKAREVINANKKAKDWPELKAILVHNFGDKRSEAVMLYDLNNTLPHQGESVSKYCGRLKATLYALLSKVNLEVTDAARQAVKIEDYNNIALQTFLCGLYAIDRELTQEVKIKDPEDVETAESYAYEISNFNVLQKRKIGLTQRPVTSQSPNLPNTHFQPRQSQYHHQAQQQQYQQPLQQPRFQYQQRQPQYQQQIRQGHIQQTPPNRPNSSLQRRPNPNYIPTAQQMPRAPSQQQRFAPSPGQQLYQGPYRPTPMDIDTSAIKRPASSLQRPTKKPWPHNAMIENVYEADFAEPEYLTENFDQPELDYDRDNYYNDDNSEEYHYPEDNEPIITENATVNFMAISITTDTK